MERALLLVTDPQLAERELLGVPIGVRAALSLAEAGVTSAGLLITDADFPAWSQDSRARLPISAAHDEHGPRLLLRAEAFVSPRLLRELPLGAALADPSGTRLAARVELSAGDDPHVLLQQAPLHAFTSDASHRALSLATPEGQKQAKRALFAGLVKPSDGPVSRHFNRHISRAVTRLCLPLGMTPNFMTVIVALPGVLAAWFATHASFEAQLLGAGLYQLHSILDGCDGELARLTQRFGNRPEIFGWELWNEVNAVSAKSEAYMPWTQTMLAELHRLSPRNLAVQSLGSYDRTSSRELYRQVVGTAPERTSVARPEPSMAQVAERLP